MRRNYYSRRRDRYTPPHETEHVYQVGEEWFYRKPSKWTSKRGPFATRREAVEDLNKHLKRIRDKQMKKILEEEMKLRKEKLKFVIEQDYFKPERIRLFLDNGTGFRESITLYPEELELLYKFLGDHIKQASTINSAGTFCKTASD